MRACYAQRVKRAQTHMFCRPYACRIDSGNSCAKRLSGHVRGLLGPVEGASGCEESARRPSCAIPRCACHPAPLLSLDVAPEPSREKARPRSMPRTVAMLAGRYESWAR